MSQMIQICHGEFGRAAILDLDGILVEHAHSYSHLLFWLGGDYNQLDVGGTMADLNHDHAVAINSWEPHSVPAAGAGRHTLFLLLYLKPAWLANQCTRLGLLPKFDAASFPYTAAMGSLARRFASQMVGEDINFSLEIERDIALLVEHSTKAMTQSALELALSENSQSHADFRIRKSLEFMNSNLDVRSSFEDVARAACVSRPHFFTLFRKHMKMTPNVYWNTVRMETAIERLVGSDISLNELSADLGFSEPGNFSRFFRNHSGVCPSQYRLVAGGHPGLKSFQSIGEQRYLNV